jgi:hypothetical protein
VKPPRPHDETAHEDRAHLFIIVVIIHPFEHVAFEKRVLVGLGDGTLCGHLKPWVPHVGKVHVLLILERCRVALHHRSFRLSRDLLVISPQEFT